MAIRDDDRWLSRAGAAVAQVAERAGVSHQTVSRVLNDASLVKEETRLRVLAAIEGRGEVRGHCPTA